jgi:hypothetical protein
MQLNDISESFSRDNPRRPFPIFHSMVMGTVYVPYIWMRTSAFPPYNLKILDRNFPDLKRELIVLSRLMNVIAALGIALLSFYITLLFSRNVLIPFLISMAVALNPDLMFQSSVTYYENWSIFWVMLSLFCFVKVLLGKKNRSLWLSGFFIIAALAVATHERMSGYYIFSAPFLIYRFYMLSMDKKTGRGRTVILIFIALTLGMAAFCLANNVFGAGLGPVFEYLRFKSAAIKSSPDRMNGLIGLLKNQVRCHLHTAWLIFWNTGAILPFFSLFGVLAVWKKRFYTALAILLFPIGYQVLSVGLPGWTSGRYVLGQAIFLLLFSGFGIAYLMDDAGNKKKAAFALVLFVMAIMSEFFVLSMVKIADTYYHPYRVIEDVVKDPASRGKRIAMQGLIGSEEDLYGYQDVRCEVVAGSQKRCYDADIIISADKDGCECGKVRKEVFRKPPAWLVFLVKRQCYLYSQGVSPVRIQWCDNG